MDPANYFAGLYDTLHGKLPWFGTGLEESLEPIPEADWFRPVGHRSIAQLVGHMLAWRYDMLKRLRGEPRQRIELNSPEDWPECGGRTKDDYLRELARTKAELQREIRRFDYAKLYEHVHPDYPYTNVQLLEGNAHHDIYHLGQINLIAALLKNGAA